METKAISLKQVINDIRRHPLLVSIPVETIIDWTVDFIRIVGLPEVYDEKVAVIPISHFRGVLPDDFIRMEQVRTLGPNPIYLRHTTDNFHLSHNKVDSMPFTYKLQGHFIYVTKPFTAVEISYYAIGIDECGLPLIPDNAKFKRALESHIKLQHFQILYDQDKINDRVLDRAQRDYCWAVGACESDMRDITPDKLESIANMAKSLLIRDVEHHRGYSTAGNKELIINH